MLIGLVTPAFRRYAVTRLCLAQRAVLRDELAGRGHELLNVVVADDENLDTARGHGFATVEQDNTRIGRKFNDGMEYAAREGADFISVAGSDDWVHADLFSQLPADSMPEPDLSDGFFIWNPEAPQVTTGRSILLVDLASGRARHCLARGKTGVIPWVFPRKALEPSGFRPVKDEAMRGLDGSMVAGLGVRPNWIFHDPHPFTRVDFKSAQNLNSYSLIAGAIGEGPEFSPWAGLREHYPARLVDQAEALMGTP